MYSFYTYNTKIENIANNLEIAKQKSEKKKELKNTKQLENKYIILDILKENITIALEKGLNIFNKYDREAIEGGTFSSLDASEYYKSENITRFFIHENYYKIYLQIQKEKRLQEKALQTVTREETPEKTEAPKEAETVQTVQRKTIDFKKLLQGLFILSTGIILIPLYICITITKNLK